MTSYRECPACALEYEETGDRTECPYCGYEFPQRRSSMTWAAWFFVLLMLLWFLI